jgi:glycine cleavage system H protein
MFERANSTMPVPKDYRYLQTHEWHRRDGDVVTIGITRIAADELTDITYVSLPTVGTQLKANERFGEIESVKATSDLYSGVSGTVSEVNEQLNTNPAVVNTDPHEAGWMIKVRLSNPGEFDALLSADDYLARTGR